MFDTHIIVVGNVLTAPEWRRIGSTRTLVANFRVASTSRRFDRESGRWVDGNHLRVRVTCWRKLAEGVASSIAVGDPVVVAGRLFTRDWTDGDGNARTSYEMEAVAVGHDLARGRGRFYRNRPTQVTSAGDAGGAVRGEETEPVAEHDVPASYGDGIPDEQEPTFLEEPAGEAIAPFTDDELDEFADPKEVEPGSASGPRVPGPGGSMADGGDADREPEMTMAVEPIGEEVAGSRRSRRALRRQPVPA